jgi:hypothetical protein
MSGHFLQRKESDFTHPELAITAIVIPATVHESDALG